jgi:hypothetical protein
VTATTATSGDPDPSPPSTAASVSRSPHRALWPIAAALIAVAAAVHAIDASPVGVFYDDALYAILGKALATGQGYRYLNVPGAPAATHYPPGYPALLALLWRISPEFPANVALFRFANALLLGGVAVGTFVFARRRLAVGAPLALIAAVAGTAAVPSLLLASNVLSETLFLACLLPWLVWAERATVRPDLREAALLGASAGALCLIRAHAVVLPVVLLVVLLARGRRREAVVSLGAAALVLLPWVMWVARQDPRLPFALRGQYGSYAAWLVQGVRENGLSLIFAAVAQNVATCWAIVARSFSLGRNLALDVLAVLSVATLCVAGAIAFARRAPATLAFLGAYMAIVLVWPFSPLRFVWGMWPLMVLLALAGAIWLWRDDTRAARPARTARAFRTLAVVCLTIAGLGALLFNVRGYVNRWYATVAGSVGPRIQPQLVWVANATTPSDVVAADDEGAVYLYTGRRAVPTNAFTPAQYFAARPVEADAAYLASVLRSFRPNYVVTWALPSQRAAELLAGGQRPLLAPHDTIAGGRVYRRR